MTEFSIIIPVFNAELCLVKTVHILVEAIEKLNKNYEIILIDDGSKDKSWGIIKALQTQNNFIQGIRLNKNYGQHNAILCGLNHASGKYIITIDDDAEQNPNDIEQLYKELISSNSDLVYGIPKETDKGILRSIFTFIYKQTSRIENKNAHKGSSFRIFTNSLKDKVIMHSGALFFLDEILLWYTDNINYITINFKKSQKSKSSYSTNSLFDLSLKVLSISSTMPLRIVRTVGFYIFCISLILATIFVARKLIYQVPMGYTSIIVTILFSTSVMAFSLGIIGEYLGNLISLSNNKPSYSIKEKI